MKNKMSIKDLNNKLFKAVLGNAYEEINALIACGAEVNVIADNQTCDVRDGFTPLFLAAARGQHGCLVALLEHGALNVVSAETACNEDKEPRQFLETSALILAAHNGHFECVKTLIEYGAKVDQCNCHGRTALLVACANFTRGYLPLVEFLVDHGANINHQDYDQDSVLINALQVDASHMDLLSYLIDNGADITLVDKRGYSALTIAKRKGRNDVIEFLQSVDVQRHLLSTIDQNSLDEQSIVLNF